MPTNRLTAAAAALALTLAPAAAAARPSVQPVAPAAERVEGSGLRSTAGWAIGGLALALVLLLLAANIFDNKADAEPLSP